MNIIEFSGVKKNIKGFEILKGISFTVESGSIVGLIGPSGSGKTTIMKILAGFYGPSEGQIKIPERSDIGFTTQNNCFYSKLTVHENMIYFGKVMGVDNLDLRIVELLKFVELTGHEIKLAKELSGGMLRRLDFAISLLNNPSILIIDELTAGLDPIARHKFTDKMVDLKNQGKTIILSSHLLDEIDAVCDKIIFIKDGRSVKEGKPSDFGSASFYEEIVLQSYPGDYVKVLAVLEKYPGVMESHVVKGKKLIIYTNKVSQVIHHISHAVRVSGEELVELDFNKPDLNTFFNEIVEDKNV